MPVYKHVQKVIVIWIRVIDLFPFDHSISPPASVWQVQPIQNHWKTNVAPFDMSIVKRTAIC